MELGRPFEPRAIVPLTEDEYKRMTEAAMTLQQRVLLALLRDTGGRASAICSLRVEDVGPDYIILQDDTAKNKVTSTAPIRPETADLLRRGITVSNGRIFRANRRTLWTMVQKVARRAGIAEKVYPHLFRHMKALDFRRSKAQPDTVRNTLGWKDTSQYDNRYGKRVATETMNVARALLDKTPQEVRDPTKAIEQLGCNISPGENRPTNLSSIDIDPTIEAKGSKKGRTGQFPVLRPLALSTTDGQVET